MKEVIDYSKPLKNAKYERFCQEYIVDNNATQAAIKAKYSKKTAGVRASQLLRILIIKNRIAYLQGQLSKASGVTARQIIDEFKKIAFGRVSKTLTNGHKIKALENLGKVKGIYEVDNRQKVDPVMDLIKEISGSGSGLQIKD